VLDGAPVDRPGGDVRPFAAGDGAFVVGEVAVLSRPDTLGVPRNMRFRIGRGATHPYAGKLALGAWTYTAPFRDLADTLPSGQPVRHRGSRGGYLIADQEVWSPGNGRPAVLRAFAQIGVGDARVNQIGSYVGAGLTLAAPFQSRTQDELGLAVAAARNGSHYLNARVRSGLTVAGETAMELTYFAQLGPGLSVQPDVQYVIHPGGTLANRNALVPGIRIAASR
jgi:porin